MLRGTLVAASDHHIENRCWDLRSGVGVGGSAGFSLLLLPIPGCAALLISPTWTHQLRRRARLTPAFRAGMGLSWPPGEGRGVGVEQILPPVGRHRCGRTPTQPNLAVAGTRLSEKGRARRGTAAGKQAEGRPAGGREGGSAWARLCHWFPSSFLPFRRFSFSSDSYLSCGERWSGRSQLILTAHARLSQGTAVREERRARGRAGGERGVYVSRESLARCARTHVRRGGGAFVRDDDSAVDTHLDSFWPSFFLFSPSAARRAARQSGGARTGADRPIDRLAGWLGLQVPPPRAWVICEGRRRFLLISPPPQSPPFPALTLTRSQYSRN